MKVQEKDKADPSFFRFLDICVRFSVLIALDTFVHFRGFMEDRSACIILGLDNIEARKVSPRVVHAFLCICDSRLSCF
jgi:hypothetical protein